MNIDMIREGLILQNRYKLLQLLGRGSMGQVFLSEDLKRKSLLALKVVKPQKKQTHFLKEEFQLLSHLSHPHLSQVYDFGFLPEGQCFYTMEYIEGTHLWDATEKADPDKFYRWLVQICRVLQYLDSKGYIHCDLKPHNIMISAKKEDVKLMDFGLALLQNQNPGGGIRGTLAYMAPEMAKGGRIDHRTDLYSLGAVLYHTLTRQLPFEAPRPLELLQKHIEEVPRPPRELNAEISPLLERIILKLMAKEPSERYQSANEVIMVINQNTPYSFSLETGDTLKGRLSSSKLVGRQEELREFQEGLEKRFEQNLLEETPSWIFLTGAEGIGKSRLFQEFKWLVQLRGIRALSLDLREGEGGISEPSVEILQELVGDRDLESFPARYRPYLSRVLGGPSEEDFPQLKEEKESVRFFFQISDFLAWYSHSQPYVLFIDNFQKASEDFLELIQYLGKFSKRAPLLILCALGEDRQIIQTLERDLELERAIRVVELKRLEDDEVRELIESMFSLREEEGKRLMEFIEPSGGIPLLIEELLKVLLEEKVIVYQDGRWKLKKQKLESFRVPRGLAHLFKLRFSHLSPESFSLLKIAALLARPVSRDFFQKITTLSPQHLKQELDSLRNNHFFYEEFQKPGLFQFSHNKLREVLLENLEEEEKRELHLKIAQGLLLQSEELEEEIPYGEIGLYFQKGGEKERALEYLFLAARKSVDVYSHHKGIFYYLALLEILTPEEERWPEGMRELGRLYSLVGELHQASKTYGNLLECQRLSPMEKGEIYHSLGRIYRKMGNSLRAGELYQKALEAFPLEERELRAETLASLAWDLALVGHYREALEKIEEGFSHLKDQNTSAEASLYNSEMVIHYYEGNLPKAAEGVERSLKIREALGDEPGMALCLNNLGVILKEQGRFGESLPHFEKALEISQRISDVLLTPSILNNFGSVLQEQGKFEDSLSLLRKSLDLKLKLGNPSGIAGTLNNIGYLLFWQGEYGKALEYYNSSLKIEEELSNFQEMALSLNNLAALYIEVGMYEEAREYLQRVETMGAEQNLAIQKAYCQRLMARIDMAQGAQVPAFQRLEEALNLAEEGNYVSQMVLTHLVSAEIAFRAREMTRAQEALEKARKLAGDTESLLLECQLSHLFSLLEKEPHLRLEKLQHTADLLQKIKLPELEWKNQAALAREREGRGDLKEALRHYQKALKIIKEIYQKIPRALRKAFVEAPERVQVRESFIQLNSRILSMERDFFLGDFASLGEEGTSLSSAPSLGELHSTLENYHQTVDGILKKSLSITGVQGAAFFSFDRKKTLLENLEGIDEKEMEGLMEDLALEEKAQKLSFSPSLLTYPTEKKQFYLFPLYHHLSWEEKRLSGERRENLLERSQTKRMGALFLKASEKLSSSQVAFIEEMAIHSSLALYNARMFWEANMDPLTGLFHGAAFEHRLKQEWEKSKESGGFFSLLFMDILNIRQINQAIGYTQGSQLLGTLARSMVKALRIRDVMSRYSGQVFAFILPETNGTQAQACAEKILFTLTKLGQSRGLTLDIRLGFSTFPLDALQIKDLLVRAKQALQAAREGEERIQQWKWDFGHIPALPALSGSIPQVARTVMEALGELQEYRDSRKALSYLMDTLLELTRLDRAFLWGPSSEEGFVPYWGRDNQRQTIPPQELSSTIPLEVFEKKEIFYVMDTGMAPGKRTISMDRFSLSTVLAFPLISRQKILGVIYLDASRKIRKNLEENLPLFGLLANQAIIFLPDLLVREEKAPPLSPLETLRRAYSEGTRDRLRLFWDWTTFLNLETEDLEDLLEAFLAREEKREEALPSRSYSRQILEELHQNKPPLSSSALILKILWEYLEKGELRENFEGEMTGKFREFLGK